MQVAQGAQNDQSADHPAASAGGRGPVRARLIGRFRLWHDRDGDLTPKGAKAQALLALVLTSPEMTRGRLWLQDKLWSDRAHQQGSASLRQALREIRRALGDHAELLRADRQSVALARGRIALETAPPEPGAEFLEGLDVRDAEFNTWLAAQRADRAAPAAAPAGADAPGGRAAPPRRAPPVSVLFLAETDAPGPCRITETLFIDGVARTLTEELDVEIYRRPPSPAPPGLLLASVQAFQAPNRQMGLRVSVEDLDSGRVLWSEMQASPFNGAPNTGDIAILGLGNRLAATLKSAVLEARLSSRGDPDANVLAALAVRKMFTMRREELLAAEPLLQQAFEIQPRGVFKSWLAQLYSIQYVERVRPIEDIRDRSEASCAHALEIEPDNSYVLASVADASLVVQRNFARSAQLAQMSVAANPANPLAWWTLASANLYFGDAKLAHQSAINAQTLAAGTRLRFWTDIQRGLAAIVNGKTVEGIKLMEASSALSPDFHPPLRYLTALYSAAGMTRSAQQCAEKLTALEPDFTFDRLANDPDYPVSVMRQHGMLDTIELR